MGSSYTCLSIFHLKKHVKLSVSSTLSPWRLLQMALRMGVILSSTGCSAWRPLLWSTCIEALVSIGPLLKYGAIVVSHLSAPYTVKSVRIS